MKAEYKRLEKKNFANALQEYAVDSIVRPLGKFSSLKYVVGWYGYPLAHDTV